MSEQTQQTKPTIEQIQKYWNERIHDVELSDHPLGSFSFFDDLDDYHFDKLRYLRRLVDYDGYAGKKVIDIGCGIGTDLVRFAQGKAIVTGIDLSSTAIDLAQKNFELRELSGDFHVMNGEELQFDDQSFDMVFAHGVLQYTVDIQKMVDEAYRILKPGGELISQLYNKKGWLILMSKLTKVDLEHEDAPAFYLYTMEEFEHFLSKFSKVTISPERFPVKSRLHKGLKGFLFNTFFVNLFNIIPRALVRKTGWHLMASAIK